MIKEIIGKKKRRNKKKKFISNEIQYRLRITHVNGKYPDLINTTRHQFWNDCECGPRPVTIIFYYIPCQQPIKRHSKQKKIEQNNFFLLFFKIRRFENEWHNRTIWSNKLKIKKIHKWNILQNDTNIIWCACFWLRTIVEHVEQIRKYFTNLEFGCGDKNNFTSKQ